MKFEIKITDATLRESLKVPGVHLDSFQCEEIAIQLAELGVDFIECGISQLEGIRKLELPVPILACVSLVSDEIKTAANHGADWVGLSTGDRTKNNFDSNGLNKLLHKCVTSAHGLGLKVRFTLQDSNRTSFELIQKVFQTAVDAGAERICFEDTAGLLEPGDVTKSVTRMRTAFPETPIEGRFYDDRGLAMANALAGIDAGASWATASVNGLGKSCGMTDLCGLLANLEKRGVRKIQSLETIRDLSRRVGAYSRWPVDARRPAMASNKTGTSGLPENLGDLITIPQKIEATELRHHRAGPGTRYVMIDERFVPDSRQYCIVRQVPPQKNVGPGHVDTHVHSVDSLFLFIGYENDLTGFEVEVQLGEKIFPVKSPASIFIPAGLEHSYRVTRGSGIYVNHVLSGSYEASLLDAAQRISP